MDLKVTYDPGANAAMIYLRAIRPGEVKRVVDAVHQTILLDFDSEGCLIGIEVLNANRILPRDVWKGAERVRLPE